MDSACRHEDNTEWRRLLFIERSPTLKIFSGEVGPYLKLLTWIFSDERVEPYTSMSWKEGIIECKVSAEEYWHTLGVDRLPRRSRGIYRFGIGFTDGSIEENFKQMEFRVHYFNHDYTVANFKSECRIIHRWLHVFGFHHDDFDIHPPVADCLSEMYGYIRVELIDRYRDQGNRSVLFSGSMTIKEDTFSCDDDLRVFQNFWWWEYCSEEGGGIRSMLVHFDRQTTILRGNVHYGSESTRDI
jgi:hypothetical protein